MRWPINGAFYGLSPLGPRGGSWHYTHLGHFPYVFHSSDACLLFVLFAFAFASAFTFVQLGRSLAAYETGPSLQVHFLREWKGRSECETRKVLALSLGCWEGGLALGMRFQPPALGF